MAVYKSKISEMKYCYIWAILLYYSIGLILCTILYSISGNKNESIIPFISAILFMGLYACLRINKIEYSITDEYLNIKDFKYKKISIYNINRITILKKTKWVTFKIPYSVVIEEIGGNKTYIKPVNTDELINIIKDKNNETKILHLK